MFDEFFFKFEEVVGSDPVIGTKNSLTKWAE